MSGLGMVLNTAKGAIAAQQYGLNVVGHNVANVNSESFSRQKVPHAARPPVLYGGFIIGTGVEAQQVQRCCDQLLEDRLMGEKSKLASHEETNAYMDIMESLFNENSESSISYLTLDFWNSWHDLSNNPTGPSERSAVFQKGALLSERFNDLQASLMKMDSDLTHELEAGVSTANSIMEEIGNVNQEIISLEVNTKTANDLRDKRNALLTELSKLIEINFFEQPNGAVTVLVGKGFSLVESSDSYPIELSENEVKWVTSFGNSVDISDDIGTGKIGGWLEMRDEIIPKYKAELDAMAKGVIWAVNQEHSKGVGLNFFSNPVTGTYSTDDSGLLQTLSYGDKIDYTNDFKMWIKDSSSEPPTFSPTIVDMGISSSQVTNFTGNSFGITQDKYVFTVVTPGTVGADYMTILNGSGIGIAQTGSTISSALDQAISQQKITVTNGTTELQTFTLADTGGDVSRSAKAISQALNAIEGITSSANPNSATIGIGSLLDGVANANQYDTVTFTLASGDKTAIVSFMIDSNDDTTRANFLTALESAVSEINGSGNDLSIDSSLLTAADNLVLLASRHGENIGIENFDALDNASGLFGGPYVGNGFDYNVASRTGDLITFDLLLDSAVVGNVSVDLDALGDTSGLFGGNYTGNGFDYNAGTNTGDLITFDLQLGANSVAGVTVDVDAIGDANAGVVTNILVADEISRRINSGSVMANGDNVTLYDGTGNEVTVTRNGNDFNFNTSSGLTVGVANVVDNDASAAGNTASLTITANITDTVIADEISRDINNGNVLADGESVILEDGICDQVTITRNSNSFSFVTTGEKSLTIGNFNDNDASGTGTIAQLAIAPSANSGATSVTVTNSTDSVISGTTAQTDQLVFDGQTLIENGGAGDDSAVKTATANLLMESGISIRSTVNSAAGGIFDSPANINATTGQSMIALGGENGYTGFNPLDAITFDIDGTAVTYNVQATDNTDVEFATGIYNALGAVNALSGYSVSQNGAYVYILKTDNVPIQLTGFSDTTSADAQLTVHDNPDLNTLNNTNNQVTSRVIDSTAVISWERFDSNGLKTGINGKIDVDDAGAINVEGGLSFNIGDGDLVAGNTFTVNTNNLGEFDPLAVSLTGKANSILDSYIFKVKTGGEIGINAIEIEWKNNITSGTFTLDGATPPVVPDEVVLDGMRLRFTGGTLFAGDVFTISSDENGTPDLNLSTDWQWTIGSFRDEFNRQAIGVSAEVTKLNTIKFSPDTNKNKITNFTCSDLGGFCKDNVHITVNNYSALSKSGTNFRVERDDLAYASTGNWAVPPGNNIGYSVNLLPLEGHEGFDMDNGFHIELDGARAMTVKFDKPVFDNGRFEFDIAHTSGKYSFAFSDDKTLDSHVAAALGVNTFFNGKDAMTMENNTLLEEYDYIAAAKIDGNTGDYGIGDNKNVLALADLQYEKQVMPVWIFSRGSDATSSALTTSLDNYYHTMVGNMGIESSNIDRSLSFSETMVNRLQEQRDAISAVSLDEEMISMIKYQHAYAVASKLLSVADEMMATLISTR